MDASSSVPGVWIVLGCLSLWLTVFSQETNAFVVMPRQAVLLPFSTSTTTCFLSAKDGYSRQQGQIEELDTKPPLYPKAGDVVRYFDMDGGKERGQVLVGKISFLQKQLGEVDKWMAELTELDNVGDGYYAEYPSRQRNRKKTMRPLEQVSPLAASFVRSENAFKVPRTVEGMPAVRAEQYDIVGYQGPFSGENAIDKTIIEKDGEIYAELKWRLIRNAAIAGVAGTLVADLVKGSQDAVIYAMGAAAGVGYLFLLGIKTDTLGSENAKLGGNVSNLRFILPVLVVVGVALYNKSLGDANPIDSTSPFETITSEQYAAVVIGFLTYRIPLFLDRISDFLGVDGDEGEMVLPGSAGMALKLAQNKEESRNVIDSTDGLTPILLVSGPQAAGRSLLVKQLIAEGNGRFVEPKRVDAMSDGATFERMLQKEEFLQVDPTNRYGVTKDGILTSGKAGESVVVVDANVDLAKKLAKISGARLIGVWVGLDSVDKFESRLKEQIQNGQVEISDDEMEDSIIRAKVREIVKDIEYGIVSGIFEFTILNDNPDDSLKELKVAAEYCFK
jgi:guanylate kinase